MLLTLVALPAVLPWHAYRWATQRTGRTPHCRMVAVPILIVVSLFGFLVWRVNAPFRTAQRFVDHVHAKRIDDAKAMIVAADRAKIPERYWERIRETEFKADSGWGVAGTLGDALLESRIPFWLIVPVGKDWSRDSAVEYDAHGTAVRVRRTNFR